ncbi:MAG: hypothetical protein RMK99_16470, partial [Anaerolineales bacterium]|nr:hypothetical protein [Anaerolineales bacterium]
MPRKKNTDEIENGEAVEAGETVVAETVAEPSPNGLEVAVSASADEAPARGKRGRKPKEAEAEPETPPRPRLDAARRHAIDKALSDLTKKYGEGTIMRLGEASHLNVEAISTGSLALDLALGVGGVPRGRVTE